MNDFERQPDSQRKDLVLPRERAGRAVVRAFTSTAASIEDVLTSVDREELRAELDDIRRAEQIAQVTGSNYVIGKPF